NATTIAAYLSGQADVLVTGNVVASKIAKENPEKKLVTKFIIKNSPAFIGMRKGATDLLQWVNVFILHKRLGGELDTLSVKWFGEPLPPLPTF
ncbi:MAG: transporter substrate-binding domain-containing protein, partial [Pseudomonadota bacterium]